MSVADRLRTVRQYQRVLGFVAGAMWSLTRSAEYRGYAPRTVSIRPRVLRHRVRVRLGQSSDWQVFEQIFVRGELSYLSSLRVPPKVLIDLGANVGYVSALLLSLFPDAFVLAVEPDPGNAAICRENLRAYGSQRVRLVEGGAWPIRTGLVISRDGGDGKEWAVQVRAARRDEAPDVDGWDMASLIALCPAATIDLLKVDIEGSEGPLFSQGSERWLRSVRNLCIELHGPANREAVAAALSGFDYEEGRSGEYMLYLNLTPKTSAARVDRGH